MQIVDIRLTKLLFCVHKPDKSEGRDLYSLCVSLDSCEKICVGTVLFVDPGYFVLVTEIVDADQFFFRSFSYHGKEGFFPGFQCVCRNIWCKYRMAGTDGFQLFQAVEDTSLDCFASALFWARNQLKCPLWSQRGSEALEASAL